MTRNDAATRWFASVFAVSLIALSRAEVICIKEDDCESGRSCINVQGGPCECLLPAEYECHLHSNSRKKLEKNVTFKFDNRVIHDTSKFDNQYVSCGADLKCSSENELCVPASETTCSCMPLDHIRCPTNQPDKVICIKEDDCESGRSCINVQGGPCECLLPAEYECHLQSNSRRKLETNVTFKSDTRVIYDASKFDTRYVSCGPDLKCLSGNELCVPASETTCSCMPLDHIRCPEKPPDQVICIKEDDCENGRSCINVQGGTCECLLPAQYECRLQSNSRRKLETNVTFKFDNRIIYGTSKFDNRYVSCGANLKCSSKNELCVSDSETSCACMPWDHIRCPENQPDKVTCLKEDDCKNGRNCINVEGGTCECLLLAQYKCNLQSNSRKKLETNATFNFDKRVIDAASKYDERYPSCSADLTCSAKDELCVLTSETSCSCMPWEHVRCPNKDTHYCQRHTDCSSDMLCILIEGNCECLHEDEYLCDVPSNSSETQETNSSSTSSSCSSGSKCLADDEVCIRDEERSCSCMHWKQILCPTQEPDITQEVTCVKEIHCSVGKSCINVHGGRCQCLRPSDYLCPLQSKSRKKQDTNDAFRLDKRYASCSSDSNCPANEELCISDSDTSCSCMPWQDIRCPEILPVKVTCQKNNDCSRSESCMLVEDGTCQCLRAEEYLCLRPKNLILKQETNDTSPLDKRYISCSSDFRCLANDEACVTDSDTSCSCKPWHDIRCPEIQPSKITCQKNEECSRSESCMLVEDGTCQCLRAEEYLCLRPKKLILKQESNDTSPLDKRYISCSSDFRCSANDEACVTDSDTSCSCKPWHDIRCPEIHPSKIPVPAVFCQEDIDCPKSQCIKVGDQCQCLRPDDYRCRNPRNRIRKQGRNAMPASRFGSRYISCNIDSDCSTNDEICVSDSDTSCSCMHWDEIRCPEIRPHRRLRNGSEKGVAALGVRILIIIFVLIVRYSVLICIYVIVVIDLLIRKCRKWRIRAQGNLYRIETW